MTVSFTGYRTSKMPAPVGQTELGVKRALFHLLRTLVEQGYTHFLSGMADGFDMWAAEAVLTVRDDEPRVKLTAVVPFRGQADKFSTDLRRRYDSILEQADEVVILAENYDDGVYHRRNDYLVNSALMVVCYYDGQSGGTKYTLGRAKQKGIKIVNILQPEINFGVMDYSAINN